MSESIYEGNEYVTEGGWFPQVSSLIRWLEAAGCCEYVSVDIKQVANLSHFPTSEVEIAALNKAHNFLAYVYNNPPTGLSPEKLEELTVFRRKAARFVQYRLRQLASNQEAADRAARNVESRLRSMVSGNAIRRDGASWVLSYGAEHGIFPVKDFGSLEIVAKLVLRPNEPMELEELVNIETRTHLNSPQAQAPDVLDPQAYADLKRRYDELQRDPGDHESPVEEKERAEEVGRIASELKKLTRYGGRPRKLGRTAKDKAWEAITKDLRRLWSRFRSEGQMPGLAKHLEDFIRIDRPHITYNPPPGTLLWSTGQ
jgi:hypothetical protein